MTPEAIAEVLAAHAKWASGDSTGIRADLAGANLGGAYLGGAYLRGADLRGADLRRANLGGANLRSADLGRADLRDANLVDANLWRADLRGADLRGADLGGADLEGAGLGGAGLASIRDDLRIVLDSAPHEVAGLLAALRSGRVDGSTYEGDCACLVGTIANVRGCAYDDLDTLTPDSSRPAERWFLAIGKGATPETNPVAKITDGWIVEWMAEHAVRDRMNEDEAEVTK